MTFNISRLGVREQIVIEGGPANIVEITGGRGSGQIIAFTPPFVETVDAVIPPAPNLIFPGILP